MKTDRFLSADIDPATDANVSNLKEQALQLIHRELVHDRKLKDDAVAAILNVCDDMGAEVFLKQLRIFSLILDALERKAAFREMVDLLVSLLRTGIYRVAGEALDAITVRRDAIQMNIAGKSTLIGTMNSELLTILSLGKESNETERQLKAIETLVKCRNDENLRAVSYAFKIPTGDAQKITLLIGKLFDDRGSFMRTAFEVTIDDLVRYGNPVFEILWCYSKVLEGRSNRAAFLNALQHLIGRINRPKHALRFLLADFCRYPDSVQYSDRNAIMLANILLRSHNKELDVQIEMTPEEVLNVRHGLDTDVVHYAQFRIDTVESRFATKVRIIHEKMIALLTSPAPGKQTLTVRHLLLLEREIFIFLALLSGKTAHLILISALKEYSDPKTGIYRYSRAATYLPVFLQQLKIIARCVGRIGTRNDLKVLKKISDHGLELAELYGTQENQHALVRTRQGIDNALRSITAANPISA